MLKLPQVNVLEDVVINLRNMTWPMVHPVIPQGLSLWPCHKKPGHRTPLSVGCWLKPFKDGVCFFRIRIPVRSITWVGLFYRTDCFGSRCGFCRNCLTQPMANGQNVWLRRSKNSLTQTLTANGDCPKPSNSRNFWTQLDPDQAVHQHQGLQGLVMGKDGLGRAGCASIFHTFSSNFPQRLTPFHLSALHFLGIRKMAEQPGALPRT